MSNAIIADITNENGSDSLRETIEANYRQIKQEVLSLVDSETTRINTAPALAHLIKEWDANAFEVAIGGISRGMHYLEV
ncbi:hypothetical protein Tsumi_15730 [Porphyromonas miyakawae]|uniref:Uncharacterized protein n=1 Tax=Porphyromonas miyakawae TaxID=3137470 RepID=A0ABQ0E461_9PORP